MANQKKITIVQNLTDKLKQASGLILTDYTGLQADQINELRASVKKTGTEYEVIKNRLFQRASKEAKHPASKSKLTGQTAALWIKKNDLSPIKALNQFIQTNNLPKIKFGFWDHELINEEKIKQLASLPSLDQLRARLVGQLQAPVAGLTHALNWNLQKLTLIIRNIADATPRRSAPHTSKGSLKGGEKNGWY